MEAGLDAARMDAALVHLGAAMQKHSRMRQDAGCIVER
jgi:hypothetical protein